MSQDSLMLSTFRPDLFAGKHALITGGGGGIGLEIAETLATYGAAVSLVGRSRERLNGAVVNLAEKGFRAAGFSADVRNWEAIQGAVTAAHHTFGTIDILIAGAAGNFPAPAMGMSANAFKSVVDIDLLGTFNTCRAAFEYLRTPGASIVAISAPQAFLATAFQAHVCAAKAGVEMLIKTMALELGGAGIRVNAVSPGPVEDTEGMRRLTPDEESRRTLEKHMPIGRYVTKQEIAQAVVFLCSPAAPSITGVVLLVDGGSALPGTGSWMTAFQ